MTPVAADADQRDVLAELKTVQDKIRRREAEQEQDLAWRARLVERGRELGLSQVQIAQHIGVRPNVLGQAALRERRRASV